MGEFGQVKTMGPFDVEKAIKEFEKKFKEKSGLAWDDRNEETMRRTPLSRKRTMMKTVKTMKSLRSRVSFQCRLNA